MAVVLHLLEAHPGKAIQVKTFHHYRPLNTKQGAYANVLPAYIKEADQLSKEDKLSWTAVMVPFGMEKIFNAIKNVETIVVEDSFYMFPFVQEVDKKHIILPALVNNLKNLRIHRSYMKRFQLRAKKAIWLLLFCPHLKQASLSFEIYSDDVDFLEEYGEVFRSKSRVKDLAINVEFCVGKLWEHESLENFKRRGKTGPNVKTESLTNFLKVTFELESFEFWSRTNLESESGEPPASCDCLFSLSSSFSTLKYARILELSFQNPRGPDEGYFLYSNFKSLKRLSVNGETFRIISYESKPILPDSLEVLEIPFYDFSRFAETGQVIREDGRLSVMLELNPIPPNLREINIPLKAYDQDFKEATSDLAMKSWRAGRARLESRPIIREGRIKLTKSLPGEKGEFGSRDSKSSRREIRKNNSIVWLDNELCYFLSLFRFLTVGQDIGISQFESFHAFQT